MGYAILWAAKRRVEIRRSGVDPEVLVDAKTPVQAYFAKLIRVFTAGVVGLIVLHGFGPTSWGASARLDLLDQAGIDIAGGAVGFAGLGLCLLAQVTMGNSWRVGIDVERRTDLITHGIFRWIRNPTYLGLHVLNFGIWLIWPTASVAAYALLFFVAMEIQVRAEEEHLEEIHGQTYREYLPRTRRYFPWIY